MSTFEHPSSAATTVNITATSSDPLASGNAAAFQHPIRQLYLDDPQSYQIALAEISFDHPGTGEVFVSTSLAELSRVGSQLANVVFRVPVLPPGPVHVQETSTLVKWYPLAAASVISDIEVALTTANGAPIPASGVTTVTFVIRRI